MISSHEQSAQIRLLYIVDFDIFSFKWKSCFTLFLYDFVAEFFFSYNSSYLCSFYILFIRIKSFDTLYLKFYKWKRSFNGKRWKSQSCLRILLVTTKTGFLSLVRVVWEWKTTMAMKKLYIVVWRVRKNKIRTQIIRKDLINTMKSINR